MKAICMGLVMIPWILMADFAEDFSNCRNAADFEAKAKPTAKYQKDIWSLQNANVSFSTEKPTDTARFSIDGKEYEMKSAGVRILNREKGTFEACFQTGGWSVKNPDGWFVVRFYDSGEKTAPFELNLYSSENSRTEGLGIAFIPWQGLCTVSAFPGKTPAFGAKLERKKGWHTLSWYVESGANGENLLFLDGKEILKGKGLFPHGVCGFRTGSRWVPSEFAPEDYFMISFLGHSKMPIRSK